MHPAYKWGGSYPYHANAMHFAPNDDPRAKEISSHMKMDPNTLSSPYQPWLYGENYCYRRPQECHGGYNHGYFGGPYSFRLPYPYYPPPPPPFHTHGFYPPFPGAYPACSFPPPHYSVEQPRYDYDKNTHGFHHCCGCNHGEDEKESRIERKEPKIEKNTSNSLAPFLIKDYPYPIMWVPPGFMNTESKTKEKEKHSHDHVPLEPLEPSKKGGNGETDQDQQRGDDNPLPFPIFWFPSKNNEVGEKNVDLVANKASRESEVESEMGSKPAVQKVIQVKQLGTEEEKKSLKSIETKAKSGSVEKTDNGMEGKASPKTSKLPPVCLRIDPLPRKKNGSRSPSPPGDKGRSKGSPKADSKSSEQQTQLSEGLKKSEEQSEGNIKTIKVVEKDSLADPCEIVPRGAGSLADPRENVTRGAGSLADLCENVPKRAGSLADPCENVPKGAGSLADACDNIPMGAGNGSEKDIVCKAEKKKFSENEAALIIQSACRGFQVRKSKPITKLRQISEVGKQVIELRNRIQGLESSSSAICFDNKQKLVIGETIMSLLLKLDTIQGLHPMVREVRKRVAKELVGLQEKLDSLTSQTPIQDVTKRVKEAAAIQEKSETQIEDGIKREADADDDDNIQEKSGTQIEDGIKREADADDDDNIQEKSGTQIEDGIKREADDDGIKENSETQLDSNNVKLVESAMNHEDDNGAESHNINLEPQMELQNDESNKELNNKQLQVEVEAETNQPHNTNLEPDPELQNEESYNGRELNNKQLLEDDDDVIQDKIVAESESNGDMIPKSAESDSNGEVGDVKVDDMIAKSGTSIETAAGCDMNVEPQSIEEVITKNEFVEEEKDCQSEDSVNVIEDKKDVVVMDQLVKEQMSLIMELRARVKDLENKLSKINNNKKKKNKGRRSRGCVVEDELN